MHPTMKRVYEAAREAGKIPGDNPQAELARLLNMSPQRVSNWEKRGISKEGILLVQSVVGCLSQWVQDGREPKFLSRQPTRRQPELEVVGGVEEWGSDTPLEPDEIELPYLNETELAAGGGMVSEAIDRGRRLRFARSFLRRMGVDPANAVAAKATGNSMEPVLPDGATIAIDTANKRVVDGKMYAIDHDGLFRVKLLYQLPGRGLRLRSFNRDEHPDEDLTAYEAAAVTIIGRVFWYAAELV